MSTESTRETESIATEAPREERVPEEHAAMLAADAAQAAEVETAASAGDEGVAETPEVESPQVLQTRLSAAREENTALRDQVLRGRAELENLRRRHANELEKAHKFALDGFVRELLQVRDSLELGYEAALHESADLDKLREGTELTLKLLGDVMERFGVAVVDPLEQPFDPELHQAMSMQPRADVPPNTVVAVIQKGYTLNGRLVRPALVMVSQQGG